MLNLELLVEMPTKIEDETKDEWIDRRATNVKVEYTLRLTS